MALATALMSLGSVVAALTAGAIAGWSWRAEGVVVALVGGIGICACLGFAFGVLGQIALTPILRRTQRLVRDTTCPESTEPETW
jgi:MFS family permease